MILETVALSVITLLLFLLMLTQKPGHRKLLLGALTAIAAIDFLKQRGCKQIIMMNIIGCPEGVKAVTAAHPDGDIYLAALDEKLNERAYIVPGLGDAGDRIFGTK